MATISRALPASYLPLPVAEFHILVTLADGVRHGYGIMGEVESRTDGVVRLGPGTLYSALRRMSARGLIDESDAPRRSEADPRRLFYRITPLGRDVVVAEARRMEACLDMLRRTPLLTRLLPA